MRQLRLSAAVLLFLAGMMGLPGSSNAKSGSELYAKYWLAKCLEDVPPIENLNDYYCKGWFTTIRYLPLLDKVLGGAFETPVRVFPCPNDPRCPDPLPFIEAMTKTLGEPQPQPNILLEFGLKDEEVRALAHEINAVRIEQATKMKAVLEDAISEVNRDLVLFDQIEKSLKK